MENRIVQSNAGRDLDLGWSFQRGVWKWGIISAHLSTFLLQAKSWVFQRTQLQTWDMINSSLVKMSIKIKFKKNPEIWVSAKIFLLILFLLFKSPAMVQVHVGFILWNWSVCTQRTNRDIAKTWEKNGHSSPSLFKEESPVAWESWLYGRGACHGTDRLRSPLTHPWAEALVPMQGRVVAATAMPGAWGAIAEGSLIHLAVSCTDGEILTRSPRSLLRS